ncbi:MAG: DUF2341 domain-containing protein [Candidatus Marinimicrobia bacterium]|nr:DUF2341 domain-containing protein [Candidatus Neomarinimicrobiota bacterium]
MKFKCFITFAAILFLYNINNIYAETYPEFPSWNCRKLLVIDNKENANDLTNYQIKIDITHQAEMQSDFSDLRFTSSDGQSLLSYYREAYIEDTSAVFWAKIPSILAYSEVIIFQYYGNDTANYGGNGEDVFEFFDDFSTIRGDDYDLLNALWDLPGYVKFHFHSGTGIDHGYISPKNLEMKNFYVKTKMFLEKETDNYPTENAGQAFIDYRHSDNNTESTDSFDDDDYLKFGINNTLRNNSYRGLRFDKNINTESLDQATNILEYDAGPAFRFDEWNTYEVRVYETNHQVDFTDEDLERTTWNVTTHYLNQSGRIYLRGVDIEGGSWVQVDYLMIGQYTLPEPTILTDKSEGYTPVCGLVRNSYANFLNWGNRNVIDITCVDSLIDYPVKLQIIYLTGMNTDFSDVRFTDSDGQTVLGYWNESYIASDSAVFWVKIPSIPANQSTTIYTYYNNPSATYIGNGEDVFTWFDDFETYRQSEYDLFNAVWQSIEGIVKFYSTGPTTNYGYLSPNNIHMKDLYIKTRMKLTTDGPMEAQQAFADYRYQDTNNYWRFGLNQITSYDYRGVNLESNEGGTLFLQAYYNLEQFWDEWDTYEIWAADDSHYARFTDANEGRIVDWIKVSDYQNQAGDIYFRGSEFETTSVNALLDYIIISQYTEPNHEISINDYSISSTQTVDGNNSSLLTFGETNVEMTFQSGPTGNVTVNRYDRHPPGCGSFVLDKYWDIISNIDNYSVTLTFRYTDQDIANAELDENSIVIAYYDGTNWVPVTTNRDGENNKLWTVTDHFSLWSIGRNGEDYSLPVILSSFNATLDDDKITLRWITESEVENIGFNIHRAAERKSCQAPDSLYHKINSEIIVGAGSSSEEHEYTFTDDKIEFGKSYWYKLESIDFNGQSNISDPISATLKLPSKYSMSQNHPNPFNPTTTISYDLPEQSIVKLTVFNIRGQEVMTLLDASEPPGYYEVQWNGLDRSGNQVSTGVYFCRLEAGSFSQTIKMVYLR